MKKEREKTIRLAIIAITIIVIVGIIADQFPQGFINQLEQTVEYESTETLETLWWGWIYAIGIIVFLAGTFAWILEQEKKGYSFRVETDE